MQRQLDQALGAVLSQNAAALDAQLEEHLTQVSTRLEQQLHRVGTQVRQTFLRHIVTELGRSQQVWIQQAQRELEKLARESLERNRRNLTQYVKTIGESLIRQAFAEELHPEETSRPEDQIELPLSDSVVAVFPDPHD
jgi:hypothetical protein